MIPLVGPATSLAVNSLEVFVTEPIFTLATSLGSDGCAFFTFDAVRYIIGGGRVSLLLDVADFGKLTLLGGWWWWWLSLFRWR